VRERCCSVTVPGARLLILALLLSVVAPLRAGPPVLSLIIDDLGEQLDAGSRAVDLPGPVALAFLPHTPHAARLARKAHAGGKEVLVHLPMQAKQPLALGHGGLTLDMDEPAVLASLRASLASVPHAGGVNNHMGSLLTRHPGHMTWVMGELARHGGLFFVDSRTSAHTVARRMAEEAGLATTQRDVFLDDDPSPAAIRAQFARLVQIARRKGSALAIGHPYPSTLGVLEELLPGLEKEGLRLVAVRDLIARQRDHEGEAKWQAYSSHSPTAVRSSRQ
jgi:uncharacterized protein